LLPAAVRRVCYSLAELYVKSVYLYLFGWRGGATLWNILKGEQAMKVWEGNLCTKHATLLASSGPPAARSGWRLLALFQELWGGPPLFHTLLYCSRRSTTGGCTSFYFGKSFSWVAPLLSYETLSPEYVLNRYFVPYKYFSSFVAWRTCTDDVSDVPNHHAVPPIGLGGGGCYKKRKTCTNLLNDNKYSV
jgi:hypothetical protein